MQNHLHTLCIIPNSNVMRFKINPSRLFSQFDSYECTEQEWKVTIFETNPRYLILTAVAKFLLSNDYQPYCEIAKGDRQFRLVLGIYLFAKETDFQELRYAAMLRLSDNLPSETVQHVSWIARQFESDEFLNGIDKVSGLVLIFSIQKPQV